MGRMATTEGKAVSLELGSGGKRMRDFIARRARRLQRELGRVPTRR